jgi:hypothetical protein
LECAVWMASGESHSKISAGFRLAFPNE